jgi:hypothetical protein
MGHDHHVPHVGRVGRLDDETPPGKVAASNPTAKDSLDSDFELSFAYFSEMLAVI